MTRRMIDSSIWSNENFAALAPRGRLLQLGMINIADDQGRLKAHPVYLAKEIFPYDHIEVVDMNKWLAQMVEHGTIQLYTVEGKQYAELLNWWQYQSLQFAHPSTYPRPEGWQDCLRFNSKGNQMMICNWTTPKGERMVDTCDQDGKPIPFVMELPVKIFDVLSPCPRETKHQTSAQAAPKAPTEVPPEVPTQVATKVRTQAPTLAATQVATEVPTQVTSNLTKLNLTQEELKGERGAEAPPPAIGAILELPSRKGTNGKLLYKSAHVDKAHFDKETGYIAARRGTTAVEVYYERFDIRHNDQRLNEPMEDDLMRNCPDLDKLREVITAYSRAGFKNQRNVQLILDWYQKGIPNKHCQVAVGNGRPRAGTSPVDKTQAAASELRAMLHAQGKESILDG